MNALIEAAVGNNMGRIRTNNEDNFYLNGTSLSRETMNTGGLFQMKSKNRLQIYAVCDGMGGEDAGEESALMAVETIREFQAGAQDSVSNERIRQMIEKASDRIRQFSAQRGFRSGTTMAMVAVQGTRARMVHVGDSRIYLLREKKFRQMTVDHSLVYEMVARGELTREEARVHPLKNRITQYVGLSPEDGIVSPSISDEIALQGGDVLLLCSDGLSDMVEDEQIGRILSQNPEMGAAATALVREAVSNGGKDNVTAMCLKYLQAVPEDKSVDDGLGGQRVKLAVYRLCATLFGAGFAVALGDLLYYLFS